MEVLGEDPILGRKLGPEWGKPPSLEQFHPGPKSEVALLT